MKSISSDAFSDEPILTAGFRFWLSLPKYNGLPLKSDLDPSTIPPLIIANIELYETNADDGATTLKIIGEDARRRWAENPTGMEIIDFGETTQPGGSSPLEIKRAIEDSRTCLYLEQIPNYAGDPFVRERYLMLPFSTTPNGVLDVALFVITASIAEIRPPTGIMIVSI
ncbi:MAG: hypothetical protein QNJ84_19315 [Alphaproteobacteria bacterium]|nr:hypothetical protein [Alphaproteobacteria bacterium]